MRKMLMPTDKYNKDLKNLNDLNDKIKSFKVQEVETKPISTKGAGIGMKIATDMVAGLFVGLFIGYQLDKYFGTKPLWLVVFMIIGLAAGISNMIKTAKKMENTKNLKKTK